MQLGESKHLRNADDKTENQMKEFIDKLYSGPNESLPEPMPFSHLRITDSTKIEQPEPIIKINGQSICTAGNISLISGPSKCGKSAFANMLLAGGIIKEGIVDGIHSIEVKQNHSGKAVLHFDTEQARHKQQRNVLSTIKRCGMERCPDNYLSYNIRSLSISQYMATTREICRAAHDEFGGIHLILIDGAADYIADVNDLIQATNIVNFFLQLAETYQVPIVMILHTNPGSDKERGHLGSQCQRKCESLLTVKMDGNTSYIEAKMLRDAGKEDVPRVQFMYDKEKGYHVICGVRPDEAVGRQLQKIQEIRMITAAVFGNEQAYTYSEATDAIMAHMGRAISTVKPIFTIMNENEMIIQGDDGKWRLNPSSLQDVNNKQ
jgi:hypothetical protein